MNIWLTCRNFLRSLALVYTFKRNLRRKGSLAAEPLRGIDTRLETCRRRVYIALEHLEIYVSLHFLGKV